MSEGLAKYMVTRFQKILDKVNQTEASPSIQSAKKPSQPKELAKPKAKKEPKKEVQKLEPKAEVEE